MNRVIVLRLPSGGEEVLAHFVIKTNDIVKDTVERFPHEKYIEAKFPHRPQLEILHSRLRNGMLSFQSSTSVGLILTFRPRWSIERAVGMCHVVHGYDLLDQVHKEWIDSGLM